MPALAPGRMVAPWKLIGSLICSRMRLATHVDVLACCRRRDRIITNSSPPRRTHRSRGAAGIAHALRGDDQHIVAGGVAERVVDLLEAVEVELDHGQPLAAAVRALDQRVEMVGEEGAVVQAGQPVMDGDEGHGVARVDQLVRAAQDDVRHRPEDEQRHQHDDGDGRDRTACGGR